MFSLVMNINELIAEIEFLGPAYEISVSCAAMLGYRIQSEFHMDSYGRYSEYEYAVIPNYNASIDYFIRLYRPSPDDSLMIPDFERVESTMLLFDKYLKPFGWDICMIYQKDNLWYSMINKGNLCFDEHSTVIGYSLLLAILKAIHNEYRMAFYKTDMINFSL